MNRTNFHITDAEKERLKKLSDKTGLTVAEIVRRAIDAYCDAQEGKRKGKP